MYDAGIARKTGQVIFFRLFWDELPRLTLLERAVLDREFYFCWTVFRQNRREG